MKSTTTTGHGIVPPLKWFGGKHYLAEPVIALMPRHLSYCEPFFGGGQVLFRRDPADPRFWWDGPTSDGRNADGVNEVINDIDEDLMSFYAVLKDPVLFERMRSLLDLTLFSKAEWEQACRTLAAKGGEPWVRAAALFTRYRQSYAGRGDTFTPTERTRLRGGRNGGVNAWLGAVDGLPAVHERLQDVVVLNKDAVDVIRSEDTPATLHYLDPPYVHAARTADDDYQHEMTEAGHLRLLDTVKGCRGKVILSGYANVLYDRELASWSRHSVEVPNHAAGGKQKRRMVEVLWTNF
jgi:DNA adenine methylase